MNHTRAFVQSKQRPPMLTSNQAEIHDFFDRFAAALGRGDGAIIATMWETPALVLADAGVHAVNSPKEIEEFYSQLKHQYAMEGVLATRAEIVRIERPSERLLKVLVRWPYLDRDGHERGDESTTYVLRRNDAGEPKVRIAIIESPSHGPHLRKGVHGAGGDRHSSNGPH